MLRRLDPANLELQVENATDPRRLVEKKEQQGLLIQYVAEGETEGAETTGATETGREMLMRSL
jgi:hypothetical protein